MVGWVAKGRKECPPPAQAAPVTPPVGMAKSLMTAHGILTANHLAKERLKLVGQMKHDGCFISTVELGERGGREMLQQQRDKAGQEGQVRHWCLARAGALETPARRLTRRRQV